MLLKSHQISPKLLSCSHFNGYGTNPVMKMASRICYDYEFEFYIKSNGGIMVNGDYLPFQAGEINIRKPGQLVCGVVPYECYVLCVNLSGDVSTCREEDYNFGTPQGAQPLYENPLLASLPNKLIPENPQYLAQLFKEIYAVSLQKTQWNRFKENKLTCDLLYELLNQCYDKAANSRSVNQQVLHAVTHISNHFCEEINILQLIEKTGLSKAYFHKCFRAYTKTTPVALMMALRMEKAKTLLCVTDNTIAEIAAACGYLDNVYFSFLFKKHTGSSPSQYRQQHANI